MSKIRINETVLRDAHQSLMATRMTTADMLPIVEKLDEAGYYALECWGGATYDAAIRFLNEDPWERLRKIKKRAPNTKLLMLLRGQNLLGYRHYADDVVDKFVESATKNGIDIFRIFDALNDTRNLEASLTAAKKYGAHAQLTIAYTISDIHTIDYYRMLAKELNDMGADSICLKDMAGILTPAVAKELIPVIKEEIDVPLNLHTHATSGISQMTYLTAAQAGVDILDTAISPFAEGTSQPATESTAIALDEIGIHPELNIEVLEEIADYFKPIRDKYLENELLDPKMLFSDPKALIYQVPGGMLSNLTSQLREAGSLDKYDEVLQEVPNVRKDLGYPPLVTPMSQMVGTQAVFNVITNERYQMVPNEIKDYLRGYYGKSPAPIDNTFRKSVIGDDETIEFRPADRLEPEFDKLKAELGDLAQSDEDVLTYALFAQTGKQYLQQKYQPETKEKETIKIQARYHN